MAVFRKLALLDGGMFGVVVGVGAVAVALTLVWVSQAVRTSAQEGPDNIPPAPPRLGTLEEPLTGDEMLEHFAKETAERHGVSVEEARSSLLAQRESSQTSARLEETLPDRLAGVWVEREPEFRIVAWYTASGDGLEEAHAIAAGSPVPVEIRTGATHSLVELVAISDEIGRLPELEGQLAGRWVKVQTG